MSDHFVASVRQRAIEYAGRHALAFALWRWRAALEDRTALKQRIRKLEAEIAALRQGQSGA